MGKFYTSQSSRLAFDALADRYDQWYESDEGAVIFREELACLSAVSRYIANWLEVGVGTGRFASALGISQGIDPSVKMLEYAARRGIHTHIGSAEHLPFADASFDGVLIMLTLCFAAEPKQALRESARVLRPCGTLVVGIVPAYSPCGRLYAQKAAEGHPVYSFATFRTVSETVAMAESAGFVLRESASALSWNPREQSSAKIRIERQPDENAGFVALRFENRNIHIPRQRTVEDQHGKQ